MQSVQVEGTGSGGSPPSSTQTSPTKQLDNNNINNTPSGSTNGSSPPTPVPQSVLKHSPRNSTPLQHQRASSSGLSPEYFNTTNPRQSYHQQSNSQSSFTSQQLLPTPRQRHSSRPMSSRSSVSSLDFGNGYMGDPHQRNSTASPSINELASQFASASMFDLSQSYLTPQMGTNNANLMPRIKTIELYRKNAKKSNDPVIQFQFAQYMLQTALLSGTTMNKSSSASSVSDESTTNNNNNNNELPRAQSTSSLPLEAKKSRHMSTLSTSSGFQAATGQAMAAHSLSMDEEKKLKADLLKEAISNLRKLSDRGFADAQYLLGDAYASGALGKPDLKESFTLFHLAAKHGHGEASYRAALCLEEGWGCSKDVRRAVQFLRNAASKNQPGAMLRLGLACFYGRLGMSGHISVKQEGIKWLTRSAESANEVFPQAPYELAKIYEVGYRDIVFKDYTYAVQLYVKSAELNHIPAAAKLGHAYEYGQLQCPQDAALSIHYYTIAALGGDPGSMLAMCAWYMVGAEPMLPRNEEEAYEWAQRAAEYGLAKAQFAVGYFLENGIGAERDILQSANWYRKAAAGGDERAIERLKKNRDLASQGYKNKRNKSDKKDKDCIIM